MRPATSRPPRPKASAIARTTPPISAAYVIVTISRAISSWLRIMKVAIAITSTGTTEPTTLPVGVSPIVRATSPPTAAAMAPATTKISTAAITLGREAPMAAEAAALAGRGAAHRAGAEPADGGGDGAGDDEDQHGGDHVGQVGADGGDE